MFTDHISASDLTLRETRDIHLTLRLYRYNIMSPSVGTWATVRLHPEHSSHFWGPRHIVLSTDRGYIQWWNVTKYIYSNPVLEYNFEVLLPVYSTPLHFGGFFFFFNSPTVI